MPKIKVTPKRGEKGYRGPGAKPKPKQKTAKQPQTSNKGRSKAKNKQTTLNTYTAVVTEGSKKRPAASPGKEDLPAKRRRTRGPRESELGDEEDEVGETGKEASTVSSKSLKGRVVSGKGKGKAKEAMDEGEARPREGRRRTGGRLGARIARRTSSEENSERGSGVATRRSQRTTLVTELSGHDSSGGGRMRGVGGRRGRGRGLRQSHLSSDSDEGGIKSHGRGQVSLDSSGSPERPRRRSRGVGGISTERGGPVSSDSDGEESPKARGRATRMRTQRGTKERESVDESATGNSRKGASVCEVSVTGSGVSQWETVSEEASRVMGDAMLSAMGQCVEGLSGRQRQRTERELQSLMNRVQHTLRQTKGPKTGRMRTYATARRNARDLKEQCLELMQQNQQMEERMEQRLTSLEDGKQKAENLKEMISSEEIEPSLPTTVELFDPKQVSEDDEDKEFVDELVGFLDRSRQLSTRAEPNGFPSS